MKHTSVEMDVLKTLAEKATSWRGLEFDWRPVYRWSNHFSCWQFRCSGRMVTPCRWKFEESICK